jgi:hypothetical protein
MTRGVEADRKVRVTELFTIDDLFTIERRRERERQGCRR